MKWNEHIRWALSLAAVFLFSHGRCAPPEPGGSTALDAEKAKPALQKFMQSPAVFIENRGQWSDKSIRFALSGSGANVGLSDAGPRFQLFRGGAAPVAAKDSGKFSPEKKSAPHSAAPAAVHEFAVRFEGALGATPEGEGKSSQVFNYRRGQAAEWRENVSSWDAVVYRGLYKGVDLRISGKRTAVKYEFIVAPGASWRNIRLRYDGIQRLALGKGGVLEIHPAKDWPAIADEAPYIYQDIEGRRQQVEGRFRLFDKTSFGFEITGAFDHSKPLVIDPALEWSTYLGGSSTDSCADLAVDGAGNVFVAGWTRSSGWISGGFGTSLNGYSDAYVAKISPSGAHLWSTYIGGNSTEECYAVALDGSNNIVAIGNTSSGGWVSGGFDTTYGNLGDGFVVKLNSSGAHLWSTYLGGSDWDHGYGIAVDGSDNVLATGYTYSTGWISGGFDTTINGESDAFVVKMNSSGAHLWSTYMGGSIWDEGHAVATDVSSNVVVTGATRSTGWVSGGFDTSQNGSQDAFVARLNSSGAHLWSTYLGGASTDAGTDLDVDGSSNVIVTGDTYSAGWVSGGFDTSHEGDIDAFVVKLNSSGAHQWSTYVGGLDTEYSGAVAVGGSNNVLAVGQTASLGWVSGGLDTSHNGEQDAYVVKLNSSGAHLWSTYLGGSGFDGASGVGVDGSGNIAVAGATLSPGWTAGGFDLSHDGDFDGFVAKISERAPSNILRIDSWSLALNTSNPLSDSMSIGGEFNAPSGAAVPDRDGVSFNLTSGPNSVNEAFAAGGFVLGRGAKYTFSDPAKLKSGSVLLDIGGSSRSKFAFGSKGGSYGALSGVTDLFVRMTAGAFFDLAVIQPVSTSKGASFSSKKNAYASGELFVDSLLLSKNQKTANSDSLRMAARFPGAADVIPGVNTFTLDFGWLKISVPPGAWTVPTSGNPLSYTGSLGGASRYAVRVDNVQHTISLQCSQIAAAASTGVNVRVAYGGFDRTNVLTLQAKSSSSKSQCVY